MRFFEIFFVPLHAKACERLRVGDQRSGMAAHARPSMQASWPSLRSAVPLGLSKNRRLVSRKAAKLQTDNNRQFKEIIQIMATLVLQVPDESLVSKVKQACKMIVGVASVRRLQPAKKKVYDITKTAGYREAMDDVKHGRVTHHDSVDDMFRSILGEEEFSKLRSSHV